MQIKTMKKLTILIITLIAFVVGGMAMDLSPPNPPDQTAIILEKSETVSPAIVTLDSFQDAIIANREMTQSQKAQAITGSQYNGTPAECDTNQITGETVNQIFDLPPNLRSKGYNGNLANQIRADPQV